MTPDLLDFVGDWRFDRRIEHASGDVANAEGRATFTPHGAALDYVENGRLSQNGGPALTGTRRYRWAPGLQVFFDNGRFFHTVPPTGQVARHDCAPDLYVGTYAFDNWPEWTVTWTVTGPAKDYVSCTRFWRC